jgi:ribonuclease-3
VAKLSLGRQRELLIFLTKLGFDPSGPGWCFELRGPSHDQSTGDSLALDAIEEALSHTSAGRGVNHERLEFLGDAVLRLAASEFLRLEHPGLPVGRQAALRAQLVSDRWLAQLGERCGVDQVWHLGAMAAGDSAGRATVLAEISEALIGALYLTSGAAQGGLEPVLQWLSPHWRSSVAAYLADPDLDNWKSALQEWSQGRKLGLPLYSCRQISGVHGDPERFCCRVQLSAAAGVERAEGRGPSRRAAEQQAARSLLAKIRRSSSAARS